MSGGEIKACPFCGGEAERFTIEEPGDNFGGDVICCQKCGASSHVEFGRKENLVNVWNSRTPTPREQALAEALGWAMRELNGLNLYDEDVADEQCDAAYERARRTLQGTPE